MNEHQQAALARVTDALDAAENVRELARAVAHRAFAAELHVSQSVEAIAASAVYAAFRRDGDTRTLDEVSAVADVNRTVLGQSYRYLADELDIDLEPANPHEFVSRFVGPLDVSDRVAARAHDIVAECVEAGLLSGVKPAGVAAAALYLADREHRGRLTQRGLGAIMGVSPVTIRHRCAEQTKLLDTEMVGNIAPARLQLFDSHE
jgi:transcription initiation factor TFIIB